MSRIHTLSLRTEAGLETKWQLNWAKQKKSLIPFLFTIVEKTLQHIDKLSQARVHYKPKSPVVVLSGFAGKLVQLCDLRWSLLTKYQLNSASQIADGPCSITFSPYHHTEQYPQTELTPSRYQRGCLWYLNQAPYKRRNKEDCKLIHASRQSTGNYAIYSFSSNFKWLEIQMQPKQQVCIAKKVSHAK